MNTYLTPFTPLPSLFDGPAAADDHSSLLAFLMNDDLAAAPDAFPYNGGAEAAPAFFGHAAAPLPPPVVAPPAEMTGQGRKRSFVPAGDDGSSRPQAVRRKVQGSPPTSPAHSGGDAAPAARSGGRRVWVRERSTEWWDRLSGPACPDADFRQAFRMSRATFDALCDELSAAVAKEDTALRAAIPVHQRVAVCLWRLATGEPLREVSRRFGLGISTCHNIVLQVCAALTAVLLPKAVRWPLESPAARFQALSGIPGVVGSVYTDHIPIGPPKDDVAEYYNRRLTERNNKASYSVAVQAVVDADGAFTDVCIGLPGSLSDAAVLERSALHSRCETGMLGDDQCRLVGGASYPLTDWMLVPYAHQNLTWAQHAFNERIAAARAAAQGAFQRLKGRWRCLQRRTEPKLPDLHNMIGACCVLHNFCERSGEEFDADIQSELSQQDDADVVAAANPVLSAAADKERDRIAHDLLHGGHPSVTFL
ncbi:protein ALP1-like [Triticum urartu]|uniref:protein ALP1-like n=1 Tax=Triticum urartu TaxID=4572 RepID=UPI002042F5B6|nr:protein ALP1-like [Triticum urartu]